MSKTAADTRDLLIKSFLLDWELVFVSGMKIIEIWVDLKNPFDKEAWETC